MHPLSKFTKAKSVMNIPRNKFIWPVWGQDFQLEGQFSRDLKGKCLMNGYRHLSIKPWMLFQVRIRDVQASCSRTWDLAHIPLKASRGWWAFWGRLGTVLCQQPALPLPAKLDLWLYLESTQNTGMTIMPLFQVCFNIKALKRSHANLHEPARSDP